MPDKNLTLLDELMALFLKVLLPALVGVSIKIAIEMERKKMTIKRAIISIVVGVGLAWLSSGVITKFFGQDLQPLIIAIVAITSEKIAEYALYKLNVDGILGSFVSAGKTFLLSFISGKK